MRFHILPYVCLLVLVAANEGRTPTQFFDDLPPGLHWDDRPDKNVRALDALAAEASATAADIREAELKVIASDRILYDLVEPYFKEMYAEAARPPPPCTPLNYLHLLTHPDSCHWEPIRVYDTLAQIGRALFNAGVYAFLFLSFALPLLALCASS